jgi:hypothetical protein
MGDDNKLAEQLNKLKLLMIENSKVLEQYKKINLKNKGLITSAEIERINNLESQVKDVNGRILEIEIKKGISPPNQTDNQTDKFTKACEAYKKACEAGTLSNEEAKILLQTMKSELASLANSFNLMSAEYKNNKSEVLKTELNSLSEKIKKYSADYRSLSRDCIKDAVVESNSNSALLELSELDSDYEVVIETNIRIKTGPNPEILTENKKALEQFINKYNLSDEVQQKKWAKAKQLAEKQLAVLLAKEKKATEEVQDWENKMRANSIRGYFLYAEGTVNGVLIRRMDWKMQSTAAMSGNFSGVGDLGQKGQNIGGANYNGSEIIIKTFTLTGDENNLIYTSTGEASVLTNRMKELASMLSRPELSEGNMYDMKPGGQTKFSGNKAGPDPKSSIMLKTPAKPIAQNIEIPDWTDGKVKTLIEDYKRDCAAGTLTQQQAKIRKSAMQAEIVSHQQSLILALETIHNSQNQPEDTAILLSIWRQKMKAWQDAVNSLGEGCIKPVNPSGKAVNIDEWIDRFNDYCNQGLLPTSASNYILAEVQKLLDQEQSEIDRNEAEKTAYISGQTASELNDPQVKKNILRYDEVLIPLKENHKTNLEKQGTIVTSASSGKCYSPIQLVVSFEEDTNLITDIDDAKINNVVRVMKEFPTITLTITGYHFGGRNSAINKTDMEKVDIPEYDPTAESSIGGKNLVTGDIAMLRAEAIKAKLVTQGVNASNIICVASALSIRQRATFTLN